MDQIQSAKHHTFGLLDSRTGRRFQSKTNERAVRVWKKLGSQPRNKEIQKRYGCCQVDHCYRPAQAEYKTQIASIKRSKAPEESLTFFTTMSFPHQPSGKYWDKAARKQV